ncbi:MAG: hypothetical protein KBS64_00430 [Treponema sp.]|nr:hypothetical protein [Candidatus Treponema equi]
MNTKPLLEKLTENWLIKAICFVLAAMIYFFHQVSLLETKTFSVPLEIRKEGNMLPVSGLQKDRYVKIRVRTRSDLISSITEKDFAAYVDIASRTREGTWNFPVAVDLSEHLVSLDIDPLEITVYPDNLPFEIQKKEMKTVPVVAKVFGTPAHGYKALGAQLDPAYVTLCGPKFMLDEIKEIPAGAINIDGAEYLVSKVLKTVNPNSYVSVLDDNLVKISVPVVSEGMVKELSDIDIKINSLNEELDIDGEMPKMSLIVEGSVLDIEKFSLRNLSVYVDLSFVSEPGEYSVPVMVELSPAYSLAQSSLSEVNLNIVKKEEKNTEDLNMEIPLEPGADAQ